MRRRESKLTKKIIQTEFLIDDSKAEKIADKLIKEFSSHKGIFENYISPEYILPPKLVPGSREHALFLTYVISIDCMTDSTQLWKKSRGAYMIFPDRFTPEKILKSSQQTVENFVKNIGARQFANAAKTWIGISRALVDNFQGDPRNITREPTRIQDIRKQLRLFPYLKGKKLSNLYIRVMGETGLFKIKNINQIEIPVDKHVARFTAYTGALKLLSKHFIGSVDEEPLKELIKETWRIAAKTLNTAPWRLYKPIWIIGSKLCDDKKCKKCPIANQCENVKGVVFKENIVFWRQTK
jgi:endonuclease III